MTDIERIRFIPVEMEPEERVVGWVILSAIGDTPSITRQFYPGRGMTATQAAIMLRTLADLIELEDLPIWEADVHDTSADTAEILKAADELP